MKGQNAFLKKISKNGLYIILFLCIAAVGVSGYVMYHAQDVPDASGLTDSLLGSEEDGFSSQTADGSKTIELPNPAPQNQPATPKPEITQPSVAPEPITPSKTDTPVAAASKDITVPDGPTQFVSAISGKVQVPFSGDELVKSKTFGDWRTHAGVDISAKEGVKVRAIAKGVVKKVFEDEMMGHTVVIEHADGVVSTYCNLMKGVIVKVGQTVRAGDVIGGVGSSAVAECMEAPHLHLEVTKNGVAVDPMSMIEK